jgi:DNA mismatch endonuclease (patch repair protein)
MKDIFSKKKRSEVMSLIKSKETKIEISFRKGLSEKGLKYRKNSSKYFGKPDIVFASHKIVIFIDSCFWHGCKIHGRMPTANKKYWADKIKRNKERDTEVSKHYKKLGWHIIRIWEHDIKNKGGKVVNKIQKLIEEQKNNEVDIAKI